MHCMQAPLVDPPRAMHGAILQSTKGKHEMQKHTKQQSPRALDKARTLQRKDNRNGKRLTQQPG